MIPVMRALTGSLWGLMLVVAAGLASAQEALQLHGGWGYMTEIEVERELRDALGSKLHSGTSEIQRMIIAPLLGL